MKILKNLKKSKDIKMCSFKKIVGFGLIGSIFLVGCASTQPTTEDASFQGKKPTKSVTHKWCYITEREIRYAQKI